MKKIKILFLFLFITQFIYSIDFPELTGRVVDRANVLNHIEKSNLEKRLEEYEKKTGNQMAVCFINTTDYYTIEDYSIRLAEKWKIGYKGKDNGIIMLFAMEDRKMRIEVGYGLEPYLTDLEAKLLIERVLVPHFRQAKYYDGIKKAIDFIEKETMFLTENKNEDIIVKKLQPKEHKLWIRNKRAGNIIVIILFILGVLLAILFDLTITDKIKGRFSLINLIVNVLYILFFTFIYKIPGFNFGALFGINVMGVVIGFIVMAFINPSKGGSSIGSSSYGGYSSSSYDSYSSSSYSGGGGSFGGGGASGSW